MNRCKFDGYLVGASYPIPEDPGEFYAPGAVWTVGCNQLVCHSCHKRVRNAPGFFPSDDTDGHHAEIFGTADWKTLDYLDHSASWAGHRLYACQCTAHTEGSAVPLNDEREDRMMPPWRCAGHPLAVAGERYYGIEIAAEMDWEALVARALSGWRPKDAPAENQDPPHAIWVRALYRRLLGTPHAESLSRAAAECLTSADALVRARAIRFFYSLPNAPGAERLGQLAAADLAAFTSMKNPFETDESDLEAWLWAAIGQRLSLGFEDDPLPQNASDLATLIPLARQAVVRPGRALPLLYGLARADWRWLTDHAVPVVEATPAAAGDLLVELMRAGHDEDLAVIGGMVARVRGIDAQKFRKLVRTFFDGRTKKRILGALPNIG